MTLDTRVWLHGDITGPDAFNLALRAILIAGNAMDRYDSAEIIRRPKGDLPDWVAEYAVGDELRNGIVVDQAWIDSHRFAVDEIATQIGQGLPAITEVYYSTDGPLADADKYDDEDPDYIEQRMCQVEVSWDTTYGYKDALGGCANLHARALSILHATLPPGVTMTWEDEFSGDIHDGVTDADFERFVGSEGGAQRLGALTALAALTGV